MHGITKRFGATVALHDVHLTVEAGEVHALIGENGAGKSTLMKILSGALRPDAGEIRLDGRRFAPANPLAARAAGVAMIYQELNLAPHLTVEQNVTLGMERRTLSIIRPAEFRRRIAETFARLDRPDIRPDVPVRRLPAADRQIVEIARALVGEARVLVMDEPTSSLGLADIEQLFAVVARLRATGVAVVYISHFLEEVQRVAQRYTVLRDGRNAGTGEIAGATTAGLVELMIGRRLDQMFPRVPHETGAPVLEITGLGGLRMPADATLSLHRGEILGLAGLVGAGRTELLRCIFGLDAVRRGTVRIASVSGGKHGKFEVSRKKFQVSSTAELETRNSKLETRNSKLETRNSNPAQRLAQGLGLLSEDRAGEGLALPRTITENMMLSHLAPFSRWGWLNLRKMRRTAAGWLDRLDIRARGPDQRALDLSGGNQQKVALARLLHHDVDILLLDEPTRGIDVASKAQVYRLIGELAARGKAILMVSSYVPELLGICDRIAVMHRGRLGPARRAADWTEPAIIAAAASGR